MIIKSFAKDLSCDMAARVSSRRTNVAAGAQRYRRPTTQTIAPSAIMPAHLQPHVIKVIRLHLGESGVKLRETAKTPRSPIYSSESESLYGPGFDYQSDGTEGTEAEEPEMLLLYETSGSSESEPDELMNRYQPRSARTRETFGTRRIARQRAPSTSRFNPRSPRSSRSTLGTPRRLF